MLSAIIRKTEEEKRDARSATDYLLLGTDLGVSNGLELGGRIASFDAQSSHERAHCPLPTPSGELIHDPDFALPTLAGALPWRLFHYSCKADTPGPFGYGRRASWPLRLCAERDPAMGSVVTVTLEREDGLGVRYLSEDGGDTYRSLTPRVFDTLQGNPVEGFVETRFDTGTEFHFLPGRATSLSYYRTVHGQNVTFQYDSDGRLSSISAPAGQGIGYSYNGDGFVGAVTDTTGRTHTLGYDGGYLKTILDPAGFVTTFGYDGDGRLASIIDPANGRTSYTYYGDGRVQSRAISTDVVTYSYDGSRIQSQDVLGHIWKIDRDDFGNITRVEDPLGHVQTAIYDTYGLPEILIDALGRVTTLGYNTQGRENSRAEPLRGTFYRTYDDFGNLTSEIDPYSNTTYFFYGATPEVQQKRLLLNEIDALGHVTTYTYFDWGGLQTVTTPPDQVTTFTNQVTTYTYDDYGQLESETNPLGGQRLFYADARGHLLSETDEMGRITTYGYDPLGRPITAVNADGVPKTNDYDGLGRLVSQSEPSDDGFVSITVYNYNAFGDVDHVIDALNYRTTALFDLKGRHIGDIDANSNTTGYVYDEADRRIAEIDPLGRITTTGYDPIGRIISRKDASGATSVIEYDGYDAAGSTITHITPSGDRTTSVYDLKGRLIAEVTPDGHRTTTLYDELDRVYLVIEPSGARTTTSYDAAGRVFQIDHPEGGRTTLTHDALGNLETVIDPVHRVFTTTYDLSSAPREAHAPDNRVTTYGYDEVGRQNSIIDYLGYRTTAQFDPLDRMKGLTNWHGQQHTINYDPRNNSPKLHIDPFASHYTTTYDPTGRVVTYTTPVLRVDTFYDPSYALVEHRANPLNIPDQLLYRERFHYYTSGYLASSEDPIGGRTTFSYDAGRLTHHTAADGVSISYTYDDAGRLSGYVYADGSRVTFLYDAVGRRNGIQDEEGFVTQWVLDKQNRPYLYIDALGQVTTTSYDYLGRTTEIINPRGVSHNFSYTNAGKLESYVDGLGYCTTYNYDELNRVKSIEDPLGYRTTFSRDVFGRLETLVDKRGGRTTYHYDAHDRVDTVEDPRGNFTTYIYDYWYDPIAIKDSLGNVTSALYDEMGRQTGWEDSLGRKIYDVYDNRENKIAHVNGLGQRTTYEYDEVNRLIAMRDPLERRTSYSYDVRGRHTGTEDARHYRTTFGYDRRGLMTSVENARGYVTTYAYDGLRRRTGTKDAQGNITRFFYNPVGSLEGIEDALGQHFTTLYDAEERPYAEINARGYETLHDYDPLGRRKATRDARNHGEFLTYDPAGNLKTWTDRLGATTTYFYDANQNQTGVMDPLGYLSTTIYDALNRPEGTIDALGFRTTVAYDAVGRATTMTDRRGYVTTVAYDGADRVIGTTDPLMRSTAYEYDVAGQRTGIIDPLGYRTTLAYDATGNLRSTEDPLGRFVTRTYDAVGNLTEVQSARGFVTTYAYDERDQRSALIDALGFSTLTQYDELGRLKSVTNARGEVTTTTYLAGSSAANGLPEAVIDALGFRSTFVYDELDRRIAAIDALGYCTTTDYDFVGRPIGVVDALGHRTTVEYDAAGQITTQTDARGHSWLSTYDARGARITTVDPLGFVTTYDYDANRRPTAVTDPTGATRTAVYDAVGQIVSQIDALGYETQTVYDDAGRIIAAIDALGFCSTLTRDAAGQVTSREDALGHFAVYTYDWDGNRISAQDERGYVTTYAYDAVGQRIAVTDALGHLTAIGYDSLGRVHTVTDAAGFVTTTAYTAVGMVESVTDALGFRTTYGYDPLRRRTTVKDALGHVTTVNYDEIGRATARIDALGYCTTRKYDAVGNLTQETDPLDHSSYYAYDPLNRRIGAVDALGRVRTMDYDARGLLHTATDAMGQVTTYVYSPRREESGRLYADGQTVSLEYDPVGRLRYVRDSVGVCSYTYDALGRLKSSLCTDSPGGQPLTYAYDPTGNRIGMSVGPLGHFTYSYDALGRLTAVEDPGYAELSLPGGVTTFAYDARNLKQRQDNPDGTYATWTYDALGQQTEVIFRSGDGIIAREARDLDALGRPLFRDTLLSAHTYAYDPLGQLTGEWLTTTANFDDPATRAVFDASSDFSVGTNPSPLGTWSYGTKSTLGGTFTLFSDDTRSLDSQLAQWSFGTSFPCVVKNTISSAVTYNTLTVPAFEVALHPGSSGEYTVARFTAPASGAFRIHGQFKGLDTSTNGTTTDVHIRKNDSVALYDQEITGPIGNATNTAGSNTQPFLLQVTLTVGDTIDFLVGYGANTDYSNDGTQLSATITRVASFVDVPNSGFEVPGLGSGPLAFQYNPTGTGVEWTFAASSSSGGSGIAGPDSAFANAPAPEGAQVAFLQGTESISQSLTFDSDGLYQLSFYVSQRGDQHQVFTVSLGGIDLGTFRPVSAAYELFQLPPVSLSTGSHTLTFTGLDPAGTGESVFLDSVQIACLAAVSDGGLINGGFEVPSVGSGTLAFQYAPTGTGIGWTFGGSSGNGSGLVGPGSAFANPSAPEGAQAAFLQGTGAVSQSVTFATDGLLQLSFYAAQRGDQHQTFSVTLGSLTLGTFTPASAAYEQFQIAPVIVPAGTYTLTFTGLNPLGGDNSVFLDDVRLALMTPFVSDGGLVNGSFETPNVGSGPLAYQGNPSGAGVGWTFDSSSGVVGPGSGFNNTLAVAGEQGAFLQGTGACSQSLTFATDGFFQLSFVAAQRQAGLTLQHQTFSVSIGSTDLGSFTPTDRFYEYFQIPAVFLTAGTYDLTFAGLNPLGGDNTAFLDKVQVLFMESLLEPTIWRVTYSYDPARRRNHTVDDAGNVATYNYDAADQLLSKETGASQVTSFVYDLNGSQVFSQDPAGYFTTYTWDAANRLAAVTPPDTVTTRFHYRYDGLRHNWVRLENREVTLFDGVSDDYLLWKRALENVWVDDAIPAGATPYENNSDTNESWDWVTSDPTPYSGQWAHRSGLVPGAMHQHYFMNASTGLTVASGDTLFAYIYLDPDHVPDEVMLQWYAGGLDWMRAYWGANNLTDWGIDGTNTRRYMGPLPETGCWVRLEVPASLVGLEGETITGMAFTLWGGRAAWDRAGSISASSVDHATGLFVQRPQDASVGAAAGLVRAVGDVGGSVALARQYHLDALGSVLETTDISGSPTPTLGAEYLTDAWGSPLLGTAGTATNAFGFLGGQGYWYQPDLGLYYVRARWLHSPTGRWLSADPVETELRYAYASNGPTFRTDPTGTLSILDTLQAGKQWVAGQAESAGRWIEDRSQQVVSGVRDLGVQAWEGAKRAGAQAWRGAVAVKDTVLNGGRHLIQIFGETGREFIVEPWMDAWQAVQRGAVLLQEQAKKLYAHATGVLGNAWDTLKRVFQTTTADWERVRKNLPPVLANVAPPSPTDVPGFTQYQLGMLWGAVQGLFGMIPVVGMIPDIVQFLQYFFDEIGKGGFWNTIWEYLKLQWQSFASLFTQDLKAAPFERGQLLGGALIGVIIAIVGIVLAALSAGLSIEFSAAGILRLLKFAGKEAIQTAKTELRENVQAVRQGAREFGHGFGKAVRTGGDLLHGRTRFTEVGAHMPRLLRGAGGKVVSGARAHIGGQFHEFRQAVGSYAELVTRAKQGYKRLQSHNLALEEGQVLRKGLIEEEHERSLIDASSDIDDTPDGSSDFQRSMKLSAKEAETETTRLKNVLGFGAPSEFKNLKTAEKYLKSKYFDKEVGAFYDARGNLIGDAGVWKGTMEAISYPDYVYDKIAGRRGVIAVHTHPQPISFSNADIRTMLSLNVSEKRVYTPDYTFTIKPGERGKVPSLTNYDDLMKFGDRVEDDLRARLANYDDLYKETFSPPDESLKEVLSSQRAENMLPEHRRWEALSIEGWFNYSAEASHPSKAITPLENIWEKYREKYKADTGEEITMNLKQYIRSLKPAGYGY